MSAPIRAVIRWFCLLLVCLPGLAWSHALHYSVDEAEAAVVVSLDFGHGEPPSDASYALFRPAQSDAFQTGRSDATGRIAFVPDQAGEWRLQVTTEDGHGLELRIEVDEAAQVMHVAGPGLGHWAAFGAGIGYLFGVAGLLIVWRRWQAGRTQ